MKIYINKNCNGYHWFEGEPLGKTGKLEMPEVTVVGKASSYYLDKLFLYAQYEAVLIENDKPGEPACFLAINNLPEHHRKDTFGRPLNFQLIFAGDDFCEISRFLFAYLSGREKFAEVFSPMFSAGSVNLICDCDRLNAYWQDLSGRKLKEAAGKIFNPGRPVKFIYTKSPETISEKFGWNKRDIEKINHKSLDSFAEMEFFEKEPVIDGDGSGSSGDDDLKELRGQIQRLTAENKRLAEENKGLRDNLGSDTVGEKELQGKIQDLADKNRALAGKVTDLERKIKYLCSENERLTAMNEKLKKGCTIALVVAVLFFFIYIFL